MRVGLGVKLGWLGRLPVPGRSWAGEQLCKTNSTPTKFKAITPSSCPCLHPVSHTTEGFYGQGWCSGEIHIAGLGCDKDLVQV